MSDFDSNSPLQRTTDGDAGGSPLGTNGRNQGGLDTPNDGTTTMGGTAGADLTAIREDMEVVGSDGRHVGEIDHFRDGQLKLKRQDSEALDGQHHLIPGQWVQQVDANANRVVLSIDKDQATREWTPAG